MYTIYDTVFWHSISEVTANQKLTELVFKGNTLSKMNPTTWEGMENHARKWYQKLWTFLFEVTFVHNFCISRYVKIEYTRKRYYTDKRDERFYQK